MREILVRQQKRIEELLTAPDLLQQTLPGVEQAQREAERRYWPRRLEKLTGELDTEPKRIRKTYEVRHPRGARRPGLPGPPLGLSQGSWPRGRSVAGQQLLDLAVATPDELTHSGPISRAIA